MHKSRLGTVVIDCQTDNLDEAADFWCRALGRSKGKTDEKYVWLEGNRDEPAVIVQKVDHQSRVHLDIETDNIDEEVERLRRLGASVVKKMKKWVVMEAPTKHRFCIIGKICENFDNKANRWD